MAGLEQPWTKYYFITAGGIKVGAIRVVDKKNGSRKRISPIWIMQDYRNKGYAQQAILEAEKIYGSDHWCLNTILQEKGNLHLYEKLGYHQTVGTVPSSNPSSTNRAPLFRLDRNCMNFYTWIQYCYWCGTEMNHD
jgi:predicted acetyltransferase